MAALVAFAAYLTARFPSAPRWLLWGWLLTIPWTLQFSTNVINPSYVLPASLVFFIGFFEAISAFRVGVLSRPVARARYLATYLAFTLAALAALAGLYGLGAYVAWRISTSSKPW